MSQLSQSYCRKYYTIYACIPEPMLCITLCHQFHQVRSKDWASKRVGFAKADHSQDGEAQGAIGSPEARAVREAENAMFFSSPGGLPGCRSTFE